MSLFGSPRSENGSDLFAPQVNLCHAASDKLLVIRPEKIVMRRRPRR